MATLDHVQQVWARMKPNSPLYAFLLENIALVSASSGLICARITVGASHLNSQGTLHGSASAALVDWAGGMAIASTGMMATGVSTDIHVSFVAAAKEGEVLEIEAKANKVGSTMAYTTIEIRRARDGTTICTGTHSKFVKHSQ